MADDLFDAADALRQHHQDYVPGGFSQTALEAVQFFRADAPSPRQPLSYPPGIAIILSGRKIGYLGGQRFEYGVGSYLVVGLPLVFECETFASPEAPLFGLFLKLRQTELLELRQILEDHAVDRLPASAGLGVEPLRVSAPMRDAVRRLLRQICHPAEAAALGDSTLREVFYHALQDRHGRVLVSLTQLSRPAARIASLLRSLEADQGHVPSVAALAREAGMSAASLHRHFKGVTGYPPLQYFKRRRLMRARDLLNRERLSVTQTAHALGYASTAQFSRDFHAMFGHPPSKTRSLGGKNT